MNQQVNDKRKETILSFMQEDLYKPMKLKEMAYFLQVANEGKMVCVCPQNQAQAALEAMRANPYGLDAAIIGHVEASRPDRGNKVFLETAFGTRRIVDMLVGEQLPRIC